MAFVFKKSSAVAVGTFNICIVQPNWLYETGIFDKNDKLGQVKADVIRPGIQFKTEKSPTWSARPERLMIETNSPDVDCGEPLGRVLELLKWTPLVAVGANIEFESDENETGIRWPLIECNAPEGYSIAGRTWHVAFARPPQVFNMQLSMPPIGENKTKDGFGFVININTDLTALTGRGKMSDANTLGKEACSKFHEHIADAIALAKNTLGVELNYEHHSTPS